MNAFPIKIRIVGSSEVRIINRLEELPFMVAFIVVETQVGRSSNE